MLERQDIDALLVGALYGELTPAEEAQLAAHLESHPADRNALDDLKSARTAGRESRILERQTEPPQAISALLLQEAARRAPRQVARAEDAGDGWFARFVRSFVAHPAMAAAAMLVLVAGVASTMYFSHHDERFADETSPSVARSSSPTFAAAPGAQPSAAAGSSSGGMPVGLAEDDNKNANAAIAATGGEADAIGKKEQIAANDSKGDLGDLRAAPAHAAAKPSREKAKGEDKYVVVQTEERVPKDLPESKLAKTDQSRGMRDGDRQDYGAGGADGAGRAGGASRALEQGQVPSSPPSPPPPAATVAKSPPPPRKAADSAPAAAPANGEDASLIAWAKSEHQRVAALVAAGKCQDAAPIAVGIKSRAPDYYSSYVVTDRSIKTCMAYINDAADRDAERATKSRATKPASATTR